MQLPQLPPVHATAAEMAMQLELKLRIVLRLHCPIGSRKVSLAQLLDWLLCLAAMECVPRAVARLIYLTLGRCKISLIVMLFC